MPDAPERADGHLKALAGEIAARNPCCRQACNGIRQPRTVVFRAIPLPRVARPPKTPSVAFPGPPGRYGWCACLDGPCIIVYNSVRIVYTDLHEGAMKDPDEFNSVLVTFRAHKTAC